MEGRKKYFVSATIEGWRGLMEGVEKPVVKGRSKPEVVEKTIQEARKNEPSLLRIYNSDGTVQTERSYPGESMKKDKNRRSGYNLYYNLR